MRNYISTEASQHQMKLVMMGAKVIQVNSKLCYVQFNLEHCKVAYVYNINKSDRFFLERIKPYPLTYKDFDKEEDVLHEIEMDIKQFQNADLSHNINEFIHINKDLNKLMKEFEDLFLYYNVPEEKLNLILDELKRVHDLIVETKNSTERVFFESEPHHLIDE